MGIRYIGVLLYWSVADKIMSVNMNILSVIKNSETAEIQHL